MSERAPTEGWTKKSFDICTVYLTCMYAYVYAVCTYTYIYIYIYVYVYIRVTFAAVLCPRSASPRGWVSAVASRAAAARCAIFIYMFTIIFQKLHLHKTLLYQQSLMSKSSGALKAHPPKSLLLWRSASSHPHWYDMLSYIYM